MNCNINNDDNSIDTEWCIITEDNDEFMDALAIENSKVEQTQQLQDENNNNNGHNANNISITHEQIKEAEKDLQAECEFCGDSIRDTELYICEYDDCPKDRQMFCEEHMIASHKNKKKINHGGKPSLHHIKRVRAQNVDEFAERVQRKAVVLASLAQKSDATVLWHEFMAGRMKWSVAMLGIVESFVGKEAFGTCAAAVLGGAGGGLGSGTGMVVGGKLGALVGTSVAPGVGTVVGAVVGWLLGMAVAFYAIDQLCDTSYQVPIEPTHNDLIDMVRDAIVFFHFLLPQITDAQLFNEKRIKKQFRKLALEYHPDKQPNSKPDLYIALQGHYGVLLAIFDAKSPIATNASKRGFQALRQRIRKQAHN